MTTHPLNRIEPREAVQLVRQKLGCTGEQAVTFLRDRSISGQIIPLFTNDEPPGRAAPELADWFAGTVMLPNKWLPRCAISEPRDDPEWQRVPGQSFPFSFDRRQLEAALRAARSETDSPESLSRPRPSDPAPVQAEECSSDRLQWDGVLRLAEAVGRLWPDLAEQICEYVHHIGQLHLRKPNLGAPGGDRVVIEMDDTYSEASQSDDGERWVTIADSAGNDDVDEVERPSTYEVPKPHPGENLKHRLRCLIAGGQHELVVRQANDLRAKWEAIEVEQLDGLDDDLFNYYASHYGTAARRRLTEDYLEDGWRSADPANDAVPYWLGIKCRVLAKILSDGEGAQNSADARPQLPVSLKYDIGSKVEPGEAATTDGFEQPEAPRDTVALRGTAKRWLQTYVQDSNHRDRDTTLEAMREAHPGLTIRGSFAVWGEFTKQNPGFQLSRRGAKSKRNINN